MLFKNKTPVIKTDDQTVLSTKLNEFLTGRLEECKYNIAKKKRKRVVIKTLFYTTTILSIVISTALAVSATTIVVPSIAIIVLSTASGILTAIGSRFNFQAKSHELNIEIEKCNKLKNKLAYVVSCNGDLTSDAYKQILSEFSV